MPAPAASPLLADAWPAQAWRQDLRIALAVGALWTAALVAGLQWDYWMPRAVATYWWAGLWVMVVLALRRVAPRTGFWLAATAYPVTYSLLMDGWSVVSASHIVPLLVATFSVTLAGAYRLVVVLAVGLAADALLLSGLAGVFSGLQGGAWTPRIDLSDAVQTAALVAVSAVLGATMRRLADTTASLAARNAELVGLQEVRAREAVNTERTRIARELHDVVAHHVSAIVVRAQAADRVADAQPQAPRDAVRWIAPAGREALDAMRSVVRVLRATEDVSAPLAPTHGIEALPGVVERVRAAGIDLRVHLPEPLPACAPAVGLAVVRVAQEALTNVLVHSSAAAASLTLAVPATGGLLLDVRDPGPARLSDDDRVGNGVVHMRERAVACGGSVVAGPDVDGGWRVVLVVPEAGDA